MTVEIPPRVEPAYEWRFPRVHASSLGNGLRVLRYHCPGQYVASVSVVFDLPLDAEPREREGVAGLVARCLLRGAGGMSADAFADALASCGAEMDASAGADGFSVQLTVPVSHLARGLELMGLAVTAASYEPREFEQEQRLRLQEIEHAKAYPGSVTVECLNAALFGDVRAGRPSGGTTQTVAATSRDDVAEFAHDHLRPGRATLVIAGDLAGDPPERLVERTFGAWGGSAGELSRPEAPAVSRQPRLIVVDWPDASQATLRLAGPGITRADPRWPALFVANYVIGGSFRSRLNVVLREQKGLTYGVSSWLDSGRRVGLFAAGASVHGDAAVEAVAETLDILRAGRHGLTDEEVATGVRAATDSAPLGYERASAVVGRVELLIAQRLPLDHVDANLSRLRRVTATEAGAAYVEVIDPGELTIVIAAPADEIVQRLVALGHGPVDVLPRP